VLPSSGDLETLFRHKYGTNPGWSPRQRQRNGYYLPADVYEALVANLVVPGCSWLDVGGGHQVFPENDQLAASLARRAGRLVAVDPSDNVHRHPYAHERVQCLLENYETEERFDLATLRMVAEHVEDPARFVAALHRLVRPGGRVVVFTVNQWAPLSVIARLVPFQLHHPIKKLVWGGEEEDTFPVCYRMNTRGRLKQLFNDQGFNELAFAYLDDLSALGKFRWGSRLESWAWRALRAASIRYPENCLLGIYERAT